MKIIQTFWSGNRKNILSDTFGWFAEEYHIMSWALSCIQLRKFYDEVILYTDSAGYELLIKKLDLPYTKVFVELNSLDHYDKELWGLSKLYTYSQQKEPFLHVDGDVYIWEAFDENLINQPLIAQNLEFGSVDYYEKMFRHLETNASYIPDEIKKIRNSEHTIMAYNAGIYGGSDIDFFQNYTANAFNFANKNELQFEHINLTSFNVFFEQYLFYCMTKLEDKKVSVLLKEVIQDNEYKGFGDFSQVPHNKKYLHLIGPHKRDFKTCEFMRQELMKEHYDLYLKILELYPEKYKNTISIKNNTSSSDLSLTNTVTISKEELTLSNYFVRTFKFLKWLGLSNDKDLTELKQIQEHVLSINNIHLGDVFNYERKIWEFIKGVHKDLGLDYMYHRNINAMNATHLYRTKNLNSLENTLLEIDTIEILSCQWNWISNTIKTDDFEIKINHIIHADPLTQKVLIIPGIEFPYYTELVIDELDELIINLLSEKKKVSSFLNELKTYFSEDDEDFSEEEFHDLIKGRLDHLLFYTCLKVEM